MDGVRPHTFEGPLVRRLIDQGIRDPRVLAAFSRVPRHFFVPELSWRAQRVLRELGYENIEFRIGDGRLGWPEAAPYDAILVAAAPETVPPALLEQLGPGGRLVIPVGPDPDHQELQMWRKSPDTGALSRQTLMQVRFVPLTHQRMH